MALKAGAEGGDDGLVFGKVPGVGVDVGADYDGGPEGKLVVVAALELLWVTF